METTPPNYARRRMIALLVFTALAAAVGFAWGRWYGYDQGRKDVMQQIEQRLTKTREVVANRVRFGRTTLYLQKSKIYR